MRSLVLHKFGDLRINDVPYPELKKGWVVLKMNVVQPSITEVLLSRGLPTIGIDKVKRTLGEQGPTPMFGHELCGVIVEVGDGVEGFTKGDRVTSLGGIPCGECKFCITSRKELCKNSLSVAFDIPGSRFAEYAALPSSALVKVPINVTDNEAAAIQPLSSCVAAVRSADIKVGETVAVLGQGVMGLFTMQLARVSGAKLVVVTDIKDQNLEMSAQLGADTVVDARKEDVVKRVMDMTEDEGVDLVFETSGGSPQLGLSGTSGLTQALRLAKPGGKIVQIAILPSSNIELTNLGGKTLISPRSESVQTFEHAISLVSSGRVKVKPLITHVVKGIERTSEAFDITGDKAKHGAINPAQVQS